MLTFSIILIIVSLLLIIYSLWIIKHVHTVNKQADEENNKLLERQNELQTINNKILNNINFNKGILDSQQIQLNDIQNNILKTTETQEELSRKAFENYCQTLDNKYKETEDEYEQYTDAMQTAYSNLQIKLMREADECREELNKLKETRTAALKAQLKEKEIKEKLSFYCLKIPDNELKDIGILETIEPKLNNPRPLRMLIWQTFWRKPMTDLCNNILGTADKCGIYKITNQITNECYIGQAVSVSDRWKQHAKCGLGIDTPANNKLYKSIQEYGIWNFSWELLEECPSTQLDEKEKYYIDLYDSKNFGFNATKGNK